MQHRQTTFLLYDAPLPSNMTVKRDEVSPTPWGFYDVPLTYTLTFSLSCERGWGWEGLIARRFTGFIQTPIGKLFYLFFFFKKKKIPVPQGFDKGYRRLKGLFQYRTILVITKSRFSVFTVFYSDNQSDELSTYMYYTALCTSQLATVKNGNLFFSL